MSQLADVSIWSSVVVGMFLCVFDILFGLLAPYL